MRAGGALEAPPKLRLSEESPRYSFRMIHTPLRPSINLKLMHRI